MNKQPFYHRATVLFTADRPITAEELKTALKIPGLGVIKRSIDIEEFDEPEPGDPADLL